MGSRERWTLLRDISNLNLQIFCSLFSLCVVLIVSRMVYPSVWNNFQVASKFSINFLSPFTWKEVIKYPRVQILVLTLLHTKQPKANFQKVSDFNFLIPVNTKFLMNFLCQKSYDFYYYGSKFKLGHKSWSATKFIKCLLKWKLLKGEEKRQRGLLRMCVE